MRIDLQPGTTIPIVLAWTRPRAGKSHISVFDKGSLKCVVLTFNMLNCSKDYERYIHIVTRILHLA